MGVDGSEGSRTALGWAARQAGLTVTSAAPQAVDQSARRQGWVAATGPDSLSITSTTANRSWASFTAARRWPRYLRARPGSPPHRALRPSPVGGHERHCAAPRELRSRCPCQCTRRRSAVRRLTTPSRRPSVSTTGSIRRWCSSVCLAAPASGASGPMVIAGEVINCAAVSPRCPALPGRGPSRCMRARSTSASEMTPATFSVLGQHWHRTARWSLISRAISVTKGRLPDGHRIARIISRTRHRPGRRP